MNNRSKTRLTLLIVTSVALMGSIPSPAEASTPVLASSSQATRGTISPNLDPIVIGECNIGFGDVVISQYKSSKLGTISLKCGDSKSGYVHIRAQHQGDWQAVINLAGGGGNWDDLMNFANKQAIEAPAPGYPQYEGSGKWCFTTPIIIRNSSGVTVRTLMPSVIVSGNNHLVITSIPTTGTPTCGTVI